MKYIIMITIVIGLAAADFVTGLLKACVKNDVSSKTMRIGGIHKIAEIIVMAVACGLEIGLDMLGQFYSVGTDGETAEKLAAVSGMVASLLIFLYITVMELISILENFSEINPEAKWALWIVKKLRLFQQKEEEENGGKNVQGNGPDAAD